MKLTLLPGMSFPAMTDALKKALPGHEVTLQKNPILRFEYLQVRKNAFVGVWIRIIEKKGQVLISGCIPSVFARVMFGGLIVILFLRKARNRFEAEAGNALVKAFNTTVI